MAEPKTRATRASVDKYIAAIGDVQRREDCRALVGLMTGVTKAPPVMWGTGIVGFGSYHYRYASGHEGDSCLTGFASRKGDISIYVTSGFEGQQSLLARLGRYKTGKVCLYVKRLADIDLETLASLVERSVAEMRRRHPD
jgi:hypothetical protein